jgi:2Fe-2S ferredoxin
MAIQGLPGSILDIALANGIDIDHSCGGVCACSTCHCIVREGDSTLSDMTDAGRLSVVQRSGD